MSQASKRSDIPWILAALLFAGLLIAMALYTQRHVEESVARVSRGLVIERADKTRATFQIEVAATPAQQEEGLMFRKSLASDAGMIFLWPNDQPVSMWMKNTHIPLDMLFVTSDGAIVKVTANAVPEDLTPLSSGVPVRAVVEIAGGEAAKQNIKQGDRVLFDGLGAATP